MRPAASADRLTLLAWFGIIVCGGFNAVAIRLGNVELTPFWGATLRFGLAAIILVVLVAIRRPPLPRGRARVGALLYGLTAFAGSYAALYWGLVEAPAATAMVVIATVPMMTLLIAVAIGQERLSARGVGGAVVALAGIAVVVAEQLDGAVPVASLTALFVGAGFIAVSSVIAKRIPPGHPMSASAIGMAASAAVLAALTIVAGEPLTLPSEPATWATVLYLALVGSVGLFMLVLYVLERWSASATSYATLVMPLVTVVAAALILGEAVGPLFVVGSAIALVGVYVGVVAGRAAPAPPVVEVEAQAAGRPVVVEAQAVGRPVVVAAELSGDCRPPGC